MIKINFGRTALEIDEGDLCDETVDAIVNAANSRLAGGGGVDGAIHRRGGPAIMEETRRRYPQGCPTGSAVISGAGNLSAWYVIHAVGPVWNGGDRGEPGLLAGAYRRSLELAAEHECRSIAFPALSTGAYGYPLDQAARTALGIVRDFLAVAETGAVKRGSLELVRFVLFHDEAYEAFAQATREFGPQNAGN